MARKRKKIKVVLRPLGQERAWGLAYSSDFTIHLDERVKPRTLLVNAIHEANHCLYESLSETKVEENAQILASLLWKLGFRLVYNENKLIKPMIKRKKKN